MFPLRGIAVFKKFDGIRNQYCGILVNICNMSARACARTRTHTHTHTHKCIHAHAVTRTPCPQAPHAHAHTYTLFLQATSQVTASSLVATLACTAQVPQYSSLVFQSTATTERSGQAGWALPEITEVFSAYPSKL